MSIITNLSCYYKLDGNPNATFGLNNGTNVGTVTYGPGVINQSVILNGTNAHISVPVSSDFTYAGNDFGFSLWFKRGAIQGTRQIIAANCNLAGANTSVAVSIEFTALNVLSCYAFSGSSYYTVADTAPTTDTNWHHVVFTRNSDILYLYVDGVLKTTLPTSTGYTLNTPYTPFTIGRLGDIAAGYFSGSVDELGIWKQSLVPYVSNLYNAGAGLAYPFDTTSGNLSYLIVAGGGSGGTAFAGVGGGGGGAGGLLTGLTPLSGIGIYPVVVGTGGVSVGGNTGYYSNSGNNSSFNGIVALGGSHGGLWLSPAVTGGSGGGGGSGNATYLIASPGTAGQGNGGGNGILGHPYAGGGGGGVGSNGLSPVAGNGGNGGVAILNSITGTSTYYAGGGGGGAGYSKLGGIGGSAIGGNGGVGEPITGGAGYPGVANTGSGGGGASGWANLKGGDGGSGIVVLSYTTGSLLAIGGTVTTAGGNTIHTFTTSDNFIIYGANANFLTMFDN